jgi:hypothetical protein
MNEAIYRSPKWLRNFVDFEVNTGDDIKGEPSKKAILKAWDERWKECDRSTFEIFYKEIYGKTGYLTSDELEKIRKTLRGDVSVWDKFDKWLPGHKQREKEKAERRREHERKEEERFRQRQKERREEERLRQERQREKENQESQRQKDLEKQLDNLYKLLISDFSANRYDDKISTPVINGEVTFHYTFENGEKFRMEGNKIYWRSSIYTVGLLIKAKFIKLINEIISKAQPRPGGQKSHSSSSGYSSGEYSHRAQQRKSHTGHPKEPLYNTLKATVKQREAQLAKMSKTDPDRVSLENELNSAKKKVKEMKDKYQFENLISFNDYFNI